MKAAGAVALSDDGKSVANSHLMRLAMEYANDFNLKCLCHCEDAALVDGGGGADSPWCSYRNRLLYRQSK